jgi:energy-coupling factor transporter ATP-binding protein EcfA2
VWKEQILTSEILNEVNEDRIERSKSLLTSANLDEFLDRNPFSLSHGQKRRLNVTAALSHRPSILLLDEPFVGQDSEGREFITGLIQETAQATGAVVVVTHNPFFAKKYCNRIIFVENGKILLDGAPEKVLYQLNEMDHNEYSTVEVNN